MSMLMTQPSSNLRTNDDMYLDKIIREKETITLCNATQIKVAPSFSPSITQLQQLGKGLLINHRVNQICFDGAYGYVS